MTSNMSSEVIVRTAEALHRLKADAAAAGPEDVAAGGVA